MTKEIASKEERKRKESKEQLSTRFSLKENELRNLKSKRRNI